MVVNARHQRWVSLPSPSPKVGVSTFPVAKGGCLYLPPSLPSPGPHELVNLAGLAGHRAVLERMRAAHEDWVATTGDLGVTPEAELAEWFWPGGVQPKTPAPRLSSAGGSVTAALDVTIDAPVDGVSIAYTFDADGGAGARPPRWHLYTGPIAIESTSTLRVRAIRYGWAESEEVRATFTSADTSSRTP